MLTPLVCVLTVIVGPRATVGVSLRQDPAAVLAAGVLLLLLLGFCRFVHGLGEYLLLYI